MNSDSVTYDSIAERPLPKWLIDQKEGLCEIQPKEIVMKENNSLMISFTITGFIILLTVVVLSIYIKKKFKEN